MVVQPQVAKVLSRPAAATLTERLLFFDNLRVVAMAMVIMQHVGQVYGPTEGQWLIPKEPQTTFILDPFFTVNRSFGMSLFFMIAGSFAVLSYNKKGPALFLKDRAIRLGIPLIGWAVFMVVMQMFLTPTPATGYTRGIPWPLEVAHMWFVQHLLILSVLYALVRWLLPARTAEQAERASSSPIPSSLTIVLFTLGLAFASACLRIWYDMDEWVYLLGFIKLQPFDLARDVGLFVVGLLAARGNWALRFPTRAGRMWLGIGLALAAAWYAFRLALPGGVEVHEAVIGAVFTLWDSFLCVSLCIGLPVLLRDMWNTRGALLKKAAGAQYATYVFHIGVVLLFQWAFMEIPAAPFVKFVLVSALSVPASFLVGYWVRKPLRL